MAPIELVLKCAKQRKSPLNVIVVINKCDDLEFREGNLVSASEQTQDVIVDVEKVIRKKFEGVPFARLFFCPYSAHNVVRTRFNSLQVLQKHCIDIDSVLEADYSK
jgi:hypothetical protein